MARSKRLDVLAGAVALFAIVSIIAYKLTWDIYRIDLYQFYFIKDYILTSLFSGLFLFVVKNRFVGALLLTCCILFAGIAIAYLIDCVGEDGPQLNNVYLSFFIGVGLALLNILYQWIKSLYMHR